MIDSRDGEIYGEAQLQDLLASKTEFERLQMMKHIVKVEGHPSAIAELSANATVGAAQMNLQRLHKEARNQAWRKLR